MQYNTLCYKGLMHSLKSFCGLTAGPGPGPAPGPGPRPRGPGCVSGPSWLSKCIEQTKLTSACRCSQSCPTAFAFPTETVRPVRGLLQQHRATWCGACPVVFSILWPWGQKLAFVGCPGRRRRTWPKEWMQSFGLMCAGENAIYKVSSIAFIKQNRVLLGRLLALRRIVGRWGCHLMACRRTIGHCLPGTSLREQPRLSLPRVSSRR